MKSSDNMTLSWNCCHTLLRISCFLGSFIWFCTRQNNRKKKPCFRLRFVNCCRRYLYTSLCCCAVCSSSYSHVRDYNLLGWSGAVNINRTGTPICFDTEWKPPLHESRKRLCASSTETTGLTPGLNNSLKQNMMSIQQSASNVTIYFQLHKAKESLLISAANYSASFSLQTHKRSREVQKGETAAVADWGSFC